MKLVTFSQDSQAKLGIAVSGHVVDVSQVADVFGVGGQQPSSVLEFLERGDKARQSVEAVWKFCSDAKRLNDLQAAGVLTPEHEVEYLPPITNPNKIICLGQNYRGHVQEMKRELPQYPTFFAKYSNTLLGHRRPFVMPAVSDKVDYEGELAIVIGRKGKNIPKEKALDYIGGYSPFNDISVRDFQRRTLQWLQGKTFDGSGPMGPALVTADEVRDPGNLDLTLRLNGTVMQHGNTSDLIFDLPTVINYISQVLTLLPGDIISTGTPEGVGFARDPQVFLKPGDKVQLEISQVGTLETPVVAS